MDVGSVAVVNLIGEAVFSAEGSLAERGDDFLEGIGIVPEALTELAIEPLGRPCSVGLMPISA